MNNIKEMNLQLFAGEGGPDGAGNQSEAQVSTTDISAEATAPETLTFTQSELDAKITGAKGQAERTALNKYLKAFGLSKSEADQILQDHTPKPEASASTGIAEPDKASALLAKAQRVAISASLRAAAVKAGFHDANDAVALIDHNLLSVDGDGNVEGAEDAVSELAKAKPHLIKATNTPPRMGGMNPGEPPSGENNIGIRLGRQARERDEAARKAQEAYFRK